MYISHKNCFRSVQSKPDIVFGFPSLSLTRLHSKARLSVGRLITDGSRPYTLPKVSPVNQVRLWFCFTRRSLFYTLLMTYWYQICQKYDKNVDIKSYFVFVWVFSGFFLLFLQFNFFYLFFFPLLFVFLYCLFLFFALLFTIKNYGDRIPLHFCWHRN